MNKRGMTTQQYIWTFYVVLVLVIFVLLLNYIRQEITGEAYTQEVLSKKLGLTLDAAYAYNGDLDLTIYFNNTFIIKSDKGFLTVRKNKLGSYGFYDIAQDNKQLSFDLESDSINIKSSEGEVIVNG